MTTLGFANLAPVTVARLMRFTATGSEWQEANLVALFYFLAASRRRQRHQGYIAEMRTIQERMRTARATATVEADLEHNLLTISVPPVVFVVSYHRVLGDCPFGLEIQVPTDLTQFGSSVYIMLLRDMLIGVWQTQVISGLGLLLVSLNGTPMSVERAVAVVALYMGNDLYEASVLIDMAAEKM